MYLSELYDAGPRRLAAWHAPPAPSPSPATYMRDVYEKKVYDVYERNRYTTCMSKIGIRRWCIFMSEVNMMETYTSEAAPWRLFSFPAPSTPSPPPARVYVHGRLFLYAY